MITNQDSAEDLTTTDSFVRDALVEWADGSHTQEAAVQLLVRGFGGRFAGARPSVDPADRFAQLGPGLRGHHHRDNRALSGGEQRYLRIAASIGGGEPVDLHGTLSLDRDLLDRVLAAIAHAAGSHEDTVIVHDTTGAARFEHPDTLYPWPDDKRPQR